MEVYLDLLTEIGMAACKPSDTLIDINHCFIADIGDRLIDVGQYQHLIERLIYLTLTRPNITYAISVASQFMHASITIHLDVVYHILRNLKTSPSNKLLIGLVVLMIGDLPLAIALLLVIILLHGEVKKSLL